MADAVRTGTVTKVETPPKGTARIEIETDDGRKLKIAAWSTTGSREEPKDNPAYKVQVGDYGTFTGYTKEEEYEGNSFTRFYASDFKPSVSPAPAQQNGSAPAQILKGGLLSPRERAVECAKDNINHLISIGAVKDVADIPAFIHELTNNYAAAVLGE